MGNENVTRSKSDMRKENFRDSSTKNLETDFVV